MSDINQWITRTRVEGLVILLVALGYLWEGQNVPSFYKLEGVPGPTVFPLILGVAFALCGLWLMLSPGKAPAREKAAAGPNLGLGQRLAANGHFYAMWALALIYLYFFPLVGYPVMTFILLAGFFYLLDERRWWLILGLALAVTLVTYLGFAKGLNVRLPIGVLGPLFK